MTFLYFDPGIGAMIVQGIVAAVAGFILFSKNAMYKIKSYLGLIKEDEDVFDDIEVDNSKKEKEAGE